MHRLLGTPLYPHFNVGRAPTHHLQHVCSSPLLAVRSKANIETGIQGVCITNSMQYIFRLRYIAAKKRSRQSASIFPWRSAAKRFFLGPNDLRLLRGLSLRTSFEGRFEQYTADEAVAVGAHRRVRQKNLNFDSQTSKSGGVSNPRTVMWTGRAVAVRCGE